MRLAAFNSFVKKEKRKIERKVHTKKQPITVPAEQSITGEQEQLPTNDALTDNPATPQPELSQQDKLLAKLRTPHATARDFADYFKNQKKTSEAEDIERGLYVKTQNGEANPAYLLGKHLGYLIRVKAITTEEEIADHLTVKLIDEEIIKVAGRLVSSSLLKKEAAEAKKLAKSFRDNANAQQKKLEHTIAKANGGKLELPEAQKWPKAPKEKVTPTQQDLVDAVSVTATKDKTRYVLTNVSKENRKGVTYYVATDGRRLSLLSHKSPDGTQDTDILIDPKTHQEHNNGTFAKWRHLIPTYTSQEKTIDLAPLLSLKKLRKKGNALHSPAAKFPFVRVMFGEEAVFLNSVFIREMIEQVANLTKKFGFPSTIKMSFTRADAPVLFSGEHNGLEWKYLLMPMYVTDPANSIVLSENPYIDTGKNDSIDEQHIATMKDMADFAEAKAQEMEAEAARIKQQAEDVAILEKQLPRIDRIVRDSTGVSPNVDYNKVRKISADFARGNLSAIMPLIPQQDEKTKWARDLFEKISGQTLPGTPEGNKAMAEKWAAEQATKGTPIEYSNTTQPGATFSIQEEIPSEMQNVHNCIDGLITSNKFGILRNSTYGDFRLAMGRKGKKGYGALHLHERRLQEGFSDDEAAFILVTALKVAEAEQYSYKQGNRMMFEKYGVRTVVAENPDGSKPIVTGFVLVNAGDESHAASPHNNFYALDELGSVQLVGASAQKALALFEHIVNKNPSNWEQIISAIIEELKKKQTAYKRGESYNGSPLDAFSADSAQSADLFTNGTLQTQNAILTQPGVTFSIQALHASPHNFRKFSTDYMGSGEGAQAFGWGLYFEESWDVNRFYLNQFAEIYSDPGILLDGQRMRRAEVLNHFSEQLREIDSRYGTTKARDEMRGVLSDVSEISGGMQGLLERAEIAVKRYSARLKSNAFGHTERGLVNWKILRDVAQLLAEHDIQPTHPFPTATNYRVELNADDSNLLMWDKPVSDELFKAVDAETNNSLSMVGLKSASGKAIYTTLAGYLESPQEASEWLAARGYKGIKYLDGISRHGTPNPTYNYVIFSGDDIKITAINQSGFWSMDKGWEVYTDPTATFSIAAADNLEQRFAGNPLAERMSFYLHREARRFSRIIGNTTPYDTAVNAIASANAVISMLDKYVHTNKIPLGHNERNRLSLLQRLIEKYAEIIKVGGTRSFNKISKTEQEVLDTILAEISTGIEEGQTKANAKQRHQELVRQAAKGRVWALLSEMMQEAGDILDTHLKSELSFDGRQVLGQTIMMLPGNVRHQGAVEDVSESFADMMVQQRAQAILKYEGRIPKDEVGSSAASPREEAREKYEGRSTRDEVGSSAASPREEAQGANYAEAEAQAWRELGEVVQRARAAVLKADPEAEIEEVKPGDRMSIIEALSTMATSKFVASGAVPQWMQGLTAALKGNLAAADSLAKVRAAYASVLQNDPAAVSELDAMLDKLGVYVQDTFREARIEAVDIQAWKHARALVTARADSPAGSGGAPVSEAVHEAERTEQAILKYEGRIPKDEVGSSAASPQEEAREAQEILDGMVPGSNAPAEMRGVFVDDKCYYNAAGGFWCGMIDKHKLRDGTEQVKEGAKGKHGVIAGRELTGRFQQNVGAIHVWRRKDGRLEVISGRHRLAHARKNGVKFIQVRVYDESAARDAAWAKLHDVEQNILDNTCNAIDVAYYFRHNPLTLAEAEARGLLPKTQAGEQTAASRIGLTVAARASEDTFALLVNGRCTADEAYMACLIASTEDGQRLALESRAGKNGKKNGWEYVTALVRGAEQMQPEDGGMLDLFGNDDSFRESSEKLARYVAAVREGLKARLGVLMSAGRLNKKGDVSKELGVKVKTPRDATRLIERLANLDAAYERLDPDLGIPAKAEAWDGKSAVPTKLDELAAGSSYSLGGVMTPEMEGIKAAAVKNGTFMKAPNGKPTNLTERQWLQVRTGAFKRWFGDWEKVARFNSAVQQLRSMNDVASITGTEFAPDGRKLTDKVTEFWNKEYGGVAKNPILGDVTLDTRSVKASIAHGVGRLKSAAFAVVHDVIEQGVLVEIAPDWKGRGEDSYVIAAPVQIGNASYVCEVVVMKGETRTGFYLHEVQIKEKLLDVFKTGVVTGTSGASKSILLDVWQRVKQIEENCSKIVDENGEPLVVYHGSPTAGIRVFEMHKALYGEGAFFTSSPEEALSYTGLDEDEFEDWDEFDAAATDSGLIYEAFLNIRDEERFYERNGGALHARAVAANEIKSATDNRGTFDGSNPDITFSVIGPKAKTWDKYKDRVFTGRDDGMQRAEIDASRARLKWEDLRGKNVAAYRKLVAEWDELPEAERKEVEAYAELCAERDEAENKLNETTDNDFQEAYAAAKKLADEVNSKRVKVREIIGEFFKMKGADGSVGITAKNEIIDAMAVDFWCEWGSDKVENSLASDPMAMGMSLGDVLDYPELYEAYPQLESLLVYTEDLKGYYGLAGNNGWSDYIKMNRSLLDNWEQFRSTLLHEVQHVIQRIEGFAKGGNKESVRRKVKELLEGTGARIDMLERDLRWFSAVDIARDLLKEARSLRRYPNAWKRSGRRFEFARMSDRAEEIREKILRDIAERYKEFRRDDTSETLLLDMPDLLLPEVHFHSVDSIEAGLAALDKLKSRKLVFRGTAAKKNRRLKELQKRHDAMQKVLSEFEYEPYELYVRLAGEIESRNVQKRRDWTMGERMARPFNETLEYPGEALVTFSIQSIMTDWSAELDNFVQNPPVHKSAAWDADVYVCPTPAVMQMVGALPLDMVMSHHVLAKVLDEHTVLGNGQTTGQMYGKEKDMGKHHLTVAELRQLPLALANPVCIAVSNHKGSIEVITDMEENGVNVLVAVRLNVSLRSTPKLVVNRITSLYGKNKIDQLVKHPMLYVNTAKAHRWMVDRGLQLPTVTKLSAGSTGRILTPEDLVKYKIATAQSFSLSGRGMIDAVDLGVMAREGQMQRLMNHARREAARWERTFAKDTPNAKAAEAMGTISSIQAAILRVLPPKYRPALAAQMRYVEVYARMLESGRVRAYGKLKSEELAALKEELGELLEADLALVSGGIWYDEKVSKAEAEKEAQKMLTRELGAEKLAQAAARMLNDAADAVERWMIDVELERVERMKERLAPRKLPNGKYDKGKMSARAYKEFVRFCGLMELDADTVAEKLHDLEALIAAEEGKDEPDADRLDKLVSQMAELAAYGNLKGKSLEAVRRGVAALTAFVRDFARREQLAGLNPGEGSISISRTRNEQAVAFDGRQVLGQTIMTLPGNVRHQGAVEDVSESFADMMVQQRAQAILEGGLKSAASREELTIVSGNTSYKDAQEQLANVAEDIRNDETGITVPINTTQRNKLTSPKARRKSIANGFTGSQHNAVAAKIGSVFKHAMLLGAYNDRNNDPNIESMKRFATPIMVDGERAMAFLTVKSSFQKKGVRGEKARNEVISRLYSVELDEIVKLDGQLKRLEHLQQNASASSSEEIISRFEEKVKSVFSEKSAMTHVSQRFFKMVAK